MNEEQIRNAIHLQVLAYFKPEVINWPPEPWNPISGLGKILKDIRDGK